MKILHYYCSCSCCCSSVVVVVVHPQHMRQRVTVVVLSVCVCVCVSLTTFPATSHLYATTMIWISFVWYALEYYKRDFS